MELNVPMLDVNIIIHPSGMLVRMVWLVKLSIATPTIQLVEAIHVQMGVNARLLLAVTYIPRWR
jgi:hypothetical protein